MSDTKLIIRMGMLSRLLIVVLQVVSNYFIPDHDANVFTSPTSQSNGSTCHTVVERIVGGFRRWDAEYFLHIAEHGYTYENTLVFYPLFPFSVQYITKFIQAIVPVDCEFRDLSLTVAILLNIIFFINAALILHQLTIEVFNNQRFARIVTMLFCFNPASVFFSAPYTESLFCWLTFSVMLHCAKNDYRAAYLPLALGMWCRSNGILNFGFVIFSVARDVCSRRSITIQNILRGVAIIVFCAFVAGAAIILVQIYYYSLYCEGKDFPMSDVVRDYGNERGYLLAGQRIANWCSFSIPYSYSYLQSYYWNVGFLKYYEFKQIPNFLLASPILGMIFYHSIQFIMNNSGIVMRLGLTHRFKNANQFVYIVHALAIAIFCLLYVHIQVSTRMLASSSPYIYWICAQYFLSENHKNSSKAFLQPKSFITKCIKAWFLGYFLIGTVLFSNYLPWT